MFSNLKGTNKLLAVLPTYNRQDRIPIVKAEFYTIPYTEKLRLIAAIIVELRIYLGKYNYVRGLETGDIPQYNLFFIGTKVQQLIK